MAAFGARWLAGGAAAFVVAGTFTASLTADRGESCEERLRAFVAAAARECTPMPGAAGREPLLDPAQDGDAMPFYRFAATRIAWQPRGSDVRGIASFEDVSDAAWPALEPIVAALRMGALARTCSGDPLELSKAMRLRALLRGAWRRGVARGEWRSVVELWLTEQAFQLDAVDPYFVQSGFLGDWIQAHFAALDAGSACALAAGLARLDAQWPRTAPARRWLAQVARYHLDTVYESSVRGRFAAWHGGFDPRRRTFDAFWRLHEELPALANADVAWPERAAQWEAFRAPAGDAGSPWAASWLATELRWRRELASLRLVRLALAFRFGEALPELADPFADAPLQVHVDGGVATFRSAAEGEALELRAQRR